MVQIKPNTKYLLCNLETGTYLTRSSEDNVSIVGERYVPGKKGLEWVFMPSDGREETRDYTIKAADSAQYLGVPIDEVVGGKQLHCSRLPTIWKVLDVDNMATVARITPMLDENLTIDLEWGQEENGTKIQLWRHILTGNNQLWLLEEVNKD